MCVRHSLFISKILSRKKDVRIGRWNYVRLYINCWRRKLSSVPIDIKIHCLKRKSQPMVSCFFGDSQDRLLLVKRTGLYHSGQEGGGLRNGSTSKWGTGEEHPGLFLTAQGCGDGFMPCIWSAVQLCSVVRLKKCRAGVFR